nr:unnamed protein product [Digitaria exilis]
MEARGGGGAAVETHRVDLQPTATLADVKALLAAKLSAAQPVPAESVRLSLNRSEELVSPDPAATLPALGLASGDLVFFTLSPLTALAAPAQALPRNPSPVSGSAPTAMAVDGVQRSEQPDAGVSSPQVRAVVMNPNPASGSVPIGMAVDGSKGSDQPGAGSSAPQVRAMAVSVPAASNPPDVVMAEAVNFTKCWSSFVLRDLKREMGKVGGAEGTAGGRLVAALHAALLEVGFITSNPMGSPLTLPQDWPSGASKPLTIKYTIPELSAMLPVAEGGKVAVLNFSLMANFVMVYGYVPGVQSEVRRLCLELPRLEPLLYLDSDQLSVEQERGILDLWRVLKDEMCLPLMISLCQLNGLRLPPCFMALPADLKTKVLDVLLGEDLAKDQTGALLQREVGMECTDEKAGDSGTKREDYVHVRAKRGQATNSHSLAERFRREKINERMKLLQDLVPGCNKITGKAMILDEIINYVQSLQRQVEFLSMKLSAISPELSFDLNLQDVR